VTWFFLLFGAQLKPGGLIAVPGFVLYAQLADFYVLLFPVA
jgi:hypothetical protein